MLVFRQLVKIHHQNRFCLSITVKEGNIETDKIKIDNSL